MAEPQARSTAPGEQRSPQASPAGTNPTSGEDGSFAPGAKPADEPFTDNAPTIISRNLQPLQRADEAVVQGLRGRRLAHFELLEPVGVGGMAAVIRSRDTQLDRIVALKILPPDLAADPENVLRFHQEARAAAKLDHENIARVFYCGDDQGLHFIAFELVEGENLRTMLERDGRIPVPQAIGYVLQIATGLAHASARGVVHRDIKPSNIIITPTGRAKLVDMGLARSQERPSDGGLTQSGVTLGTFDYISPEQALEPRDADVRSDIYSLGCTFYHMLTGQPPVPEGTAAKKLHHHQHVAPVDPRQLNPQIPDEVAVVLARMMAKDPKDRYQRPELLVQHLIVLAKKLGTVPETPDAMLFVDAALPGPPRTRPLLVASTALLALCLLILFLGTPWPNSPARAPAGPTPGVPPGPPESERAAASDPLPIRESEQPARPSAPETESLLRVSDARGLVEALQKLRTGRILVTRDIAITRDTPLVFAGGEVALESASEDGQRRPTLRLRYDAKPIEETWAALTVKSGHLTLRGLRLEVDATEAPGIDMAALLVRGGHATLDDCELVELQPPPMEDDGRLVAVIVDAAAADQPTPRFSADRSYFAGGQYAVSATGPALLEFNQCAFAPYSATLLELLRGDSRSADPNPNVRLHNCSAFITGKSAFRLRDDTVGQFEVRNCIFSRPEGDSGSGILIERAGVQEGIIHYEGSHNVYHNLKAFWARSGRSDALDALTDLDTFRQRFGAADERSVVLADSPWEEADPLLALRRKEPSRAFRARTNLRQLRQREDTRMVGVERCTWGTTYASIPRLEEPRAPEVTAAAFQRIVDPAAKAHGPNVYATLRQAIEDARSGDQILIRHNGLLAVEPVLIEKATSDLTIKPYPTYRPVLTMGQTTDKDAALFRLHDGHLHLEDLEFWLAPAVSGFRSQAVVASMADGRCSFKGCVATFKENRETNLALVILADPSGVMKMEPQPAQPQAPQIAITGSFFRGQANLITVKASRPFDLTVDDTLAVLDGSLLAIDGNSKEPGNRVQAHLSLRHATAYLTDHLVWMRANREESRRGKGLVPLQVKSVADCLLVAANSKSLIHLDGVDTEEQLRVLLLWGESRHNLYGNFIQLLDQQPSANSGMMAPVPFSRSQWEGFTGEPDGRHERLRFVAPPPADTAFSRAIPADFKLDAKTRPDATLTGYGADTERLPTPNDDASPTSLIP